MYYSLVPILALVTMFVTNFDILFNRRYIALNARALRSYRVFLGSTFIFFVVDILWGYLDPLPDKTPVTVITNLYFLAMAGLLFAWSNFVVDFVKGLRAFRIVIRVVGIIYAILGVAIVITNIFNPIVFTYDTSIYVPKYWRYIFLGLQISTFALMAVFAFVACFLEKGFKKGQLAALALFSLVIAGSVTAQLYYPLLPLYSFGLTIGTILIYSYIVVSQRIEIHRQLVEGKNREEKQLREIADTRQLAYLDPLTGTKNKHAYVEFESNMDKLIHDDKIGDFSLVIFDLNDLKLINDTYGHEAGDQYIIDSCRLISSIFTDAPMYRFGGDEFIVILENKLFEKRFKLLDEFNEIIDKNNKAEGVLPVIAAGESSYIKGKDNTLRTVFLRADERMYARKRRLKEVHKRLQETSDEVGNKVTGASLISIRRELYDMFYHSSTVSLIDMLNGSSCDDILEADIKHDTYKQLYHVNGKYFVPAVGLSYKDLIDFAANHVVHPEDKNTYLSLMAIDGFFDRLKNAAIPNFDFAHFRYKMQDGSYRWVEQAVITGEEYGIPRGTFRLYVLDIHNIKSRQLGKMTNENSIISVGRDQMTGLYASKDFITTAEKMISEDPTRKWCLLSIDIEHFKLFDEWFGREKGNYLLAKIGAKLKEFEEKYHAVAGYFGADDFNVVCEQNSKNIEKLYNEIHNLIVSFGLSAGFLPAFGVAPIEVGMSAVDAFDRTAICISKAKKDIRNRICYYTDEMQHAVDQEHRVLTEFIYALKSDEITFYLQPQCQASTGKVIGAEALARWIKNGNVVPPGEFVPILEKYGFITDLDKCIWEKVCAWLKKWTEAGHKPVPISINVSRIDIFNLDIVDYFTKLVEKYNISPKLLEIEITESAYAENMSAADSIVQDFRNRGFKVAMDDFGSGYSSLNTLSTLKIDVIKLDAKFLQINNEYHQRGVHVLESVITMAKTMSLPMIVEGVETKDQIDFLDQFGVRYIQGYYFYKPMPVTDFEKIIADEKNIDSRGVVVKSNEQFRIREFLDKNIYSDSMLNNVIGAVAIYSVRKDNHLDIVRYNQQFMEAVNVPDFVDKLEAIEKTMPEKDRPLIFECLKKAKENKLMGATGVFRFNRVDGVVSSFRMKFYYLGKKEGNDRFYGSVTNVTDLTDLQEGKELLSRYSIGNMILVRHVGGEWKFNVLSHNLADIIGIDPVTLENELNSGSENWRIPKDSPLKEFIKVIEDATPVKGKIFEKDITIINVKKEPVRVRIWIENIGGETNNFAYILRSERI